MAHTKKGRKVALVAGLALVVLSVAMVWTYRKEIRSWYALWRDFESLGKNGQGYPEYQHRETGIVFVAVPGGTFDMGSPEGEANRRKSEGPVHEVTLSPFLIAKYEVSQAAWKRVMGASPSEFKGDARPVEQVSWDDCQEFCEKTRLSLPTEAQWEYACRAGTTGPYAGTGKLNDMGWHKGNSSGTTQPIGEKLPNDFGLYDMHGNVWEWCEDRYSGDFYSSAEASGLDPLCESGSVDRVRRGGSWYYDARDCRSAYRYFFDPSLRAYGLGFRPCRSSR